MSDIVERLKAARQEADKEQDDINFYSMSDRNHHPALDIYNALLKSAVPELISTIEALRAQIAGIQPRVKLAEAGLVAGVNQYASRDAFGNIVPGDEQYPWVKAMQVGLNAIRALKS